MIDRAGITNSVVVYRNLTTKGLDRERITTKWEKQLY